MFPTAIVGVPDSVGAAAKFLDTFDGKDSYKSYRIVSFDDVKPLVASWEKATLAVKARLKGRAGRDKARLDALQSAPSVAQFKDLLDVANKKADEVNRRRYAWSATFNRIVQLISDYAVVGDILCQSSPEYSSLAWGCFRFLLMATLEEGKAASKLVIALDNVAKVIFRADGYLQYLAPITTRTSAQIYVNMHNSITTLFTEALCFLIEATNFFSKNTAVRKVSSAFRPFQSTFQDSLDSIDACERDVQQDMYFLQHHEQNLTRNYDNAIWLRRQSTASKAKKFAALYIPGTCEWFYNRDVVQSWMGHPASKATTRRIWLYGTYGYGKSTLAGNIVSRLTDASNELVVEVFCEPQLSETKGILGLLCDMVLQISTGLNDSDEVQARIHLMRMKERTPMAEDIESLWSLIDIFLAKQKFTLIIDGLENCSMTAEEKRGLLQRLDGLISNSIEGKILITSRSSPPEYLSSWTTVTLGSEQTKVDLPHIIEQRLDKSTSLAKLRQKPQIATMIEDKSEGMLLWVDIFIRVLEANHGNIDTSQNSAITYANLYDIALDRIMEDSILSQRLPRLLAIILSATRLLTSYELAAAIMIEEGLHEVGSDASSSAINLQASQVTTGLACFLRIDQENHVDYVHSSCREYLIGKLESGDIPVLPNGVSGPSPRWRHGIMADICLCMFETDAFQNAAKLDLLTENLPKDITFLDYTRDNLGYHIVQSDVDAYRLQRVLSFLSSDAGLYFIKYCITNRSTFEAKRYFLDLENWIREGNTTNGNLNLDLPFKWLSDAMQNIPNALAAFSDEGATMCWMIVDCLDISFWSNNKSNHEALVSLYLDLLSTLPEMSLSVLRAKDACFTGKGTVQGSIDAVRMRRSLIQVCKTLYGNSDYRVCHQMQGLLVLLNGLRWFKEAKVVFDDIYNDFTWLIELSPDLAANLKWEKAIILRDSGFIMDALTILEAEYDAVEGWNFRDSELALAYSVDLVQTYMLCLKAVEAEKLIQSILDRSLIGPIQSSQTTKLRLFLCFTLIGQSRHEEATGVLELIDENTLDLSRSLTKQDYVTFLYAICSTLLIMTQQKISVAEATLKDLYECNEHSSETFRIICSLLMRCLMFQGKWQEALEVGGDVTSVALLELGNTHFEYGVLLLIYAEAHAGNGEYHRAEVLFEQSKCILQTLGLTSFLHVEVMAKLVTLQSQRLAFDHLQELIDISRVPLAKESQRDREGHIGAQLAVSEGLFRSGRKDEGEKELKGCLDNLRAQFPKTHLFSFQTLSLAIDLYLSQGYHRKALELSESLLQQIKLDVGVDVPLRWPHVTQQARILVVLANPEEAKTLVLQYIAELGMLTSQEDKIAALHCKLFLEGQYRGQQLWTQQIDTLNEIALLHKELYGSRSRQTLLINRKRVNALISLSRLKDAAAEAQSLVQSCRDVLGTQDKDYWIAVNCMAETLSKQGKHEEAVERQTEIIAIAITCLGDVDPTVLDLQSSLSLMHLRADQVDIAIQIRRDIEEKYKDIFGAESEEVLAQRFTTASELRDHNRLHDAKQEFEDLVQIRLSDPNAPILQVCGCMDGLTRTLIRLGDEQAAMKSTKDRHLLVLANGTLKPGYEVMGRWLEAEALESFGHLEEAAKLHEDILDAKRRFYGAVHSDTASSIPHLANVYLKMQQLDKVEALQREVLLIWRKLEPEPGQMTFLSLANLANTLRLQKRYDEAIEMRQEEISLRTEAHGPEHLETIIARWALAIVKADTDISDDILTEQEFLVRSLEHLLGRKHNDSINAKLALVDWLNRRRFFYSALVLGFELYESATEASFDRLNICIVVLASSLRGLGRLEEALPIWQARLNAAVLKEDFDLKLARDACVSYAICLREVGKREEAIQELDEFIGREPADKKDWTRETTEVFRLLGVLYEEIMRWGKAAGAYGTACELFRRFEVLTVLRATTLSALKRCYSHCPDTAKNKSLQVYEEEIKVRIAVQGHKHQQSLYAMTEKAIWCIRNDFYEEAIVTQLERIRITKDLVQPGDESLLTQQDCLAEFYVVSKKWAEAEAMLEASRLNRKMVDGNIAKCRNVVESLALAKYSLDKHEEALKLRFEHLELVKKDFKLTDEETIRSMREIAVALARVGRLNDSISMQEAVVAIRAQKDGLSTLSVSLERLTLADILSMASRWDDSHACYATITKDYLRSPEVDDAFRLKVMRQEAALYAKENRLLEAKTCRREIVDLHRSITSPNSADLADDYDRYATVCHACHEYVEEEEALRDHVRIKFPDGPHQLDQNHVRILHRLARSIKLQRDANVIQKALEAATTARKISEQILPDDVFLPLSICVVAEMHYTLHDWPKVVETLIEASQAALKVKDGYKSLPYLASLMRSSVENGKDTLTTDATMTATIEMIQVKIMMEERIKSGDLSVDDFTCGHITNIYLISCEQCKYWFHCTKCHDTTSDHKRQPRDVPKSLCILCGHIGPPEKTCAGCRFAMGDYCDICYRFKAKGSFGPHVDGKICT